MEGGGVEGVERDDQGKGVRRPRSDAARRPRPPVVADGSHASAAVASFDALREPGVGRDRSVERRAGEKYVDMMDLGGVRTDMASDRKDLRKDDKYYSRDRVKDPHSAPASSGRHFGRPDRVSGDMYEGEGRGGRNEYRVGKEDLRAGKDEYRAGKDVGRSREYDSRSGRDERGHRHGGNGYQDNGRDYRSGERKEEGRQGRGNEKTTVEEGGKYSSKRDEYRDNKNFSRKEKFNDRRFHEKDDAKEWEKEREKEREKEKGDRRESNGTRRPEHERGKRLERSMKDIVDAGKLMKDDLDEYLGEGRGNDRSRSGKFRGRDDFDNGKERASRDAGQTQRVSFSMEKHGPKESSLKSTEKGTSEQKSGGFTKLKLKVGGVTHTIVSDPAKKADGADIASGVNNKAREPESGGANKRRRQRLILQDQSDDDEFDMPPPKAPRKTDTFSPGYAAQGEQKTQNGERVNSISRSEHQKTMTLGTGASLQAVRKSSRVPKRRVMDGDEDDFELQRPSASSRVGHFAEDEVEKEEPDEEERSSEGAGQHVAEESFEGLGDGDDEEAPETIKPVKVQQSRPVKEIGGPGVTLTARQRAMQSSKDADRESAPPLIEYPEGLTNSNSKKGKNNLSEAERQVKRLEAANRRRQQVEKAARDIQATAIQRILGQDSTRKRRENRLEKQRQDIEEEKKAAELAPSTQSIRWTVGPSGTVVSFSEDVGLPSFFNTGPVRYPPPREQCAAPTCSNLYKYRDSKSNVPLCSLQCYKAVHSAPFNTPIH